MLQMDKQGATHAGANARLQLLSENSKSKRAITMSKKTLTVTWPTGMGCSFDSK